MSQIKRFIQNENLAKAQPLIRERFVKGKVSPSAKDQFTEAREAAQNEADGNAN